jgi:hypothetical protein
MLMHRSLVVALLSVAVVSSARADGFSTAATSPTPVPANGVIMGKYPQGETETSYYFAADLKAGELASQIALQGGAKYKSLTFTLLDASGRRVDSYFITAGTGDNNEATRVMPVDSTGRYLVKVTTQGPETSSFRVALGGSALPNREPVPATPGNSTSYLAPTPVPANGVIKGVVPGGTNYTYYYFAADLKAGNLLTQLSVSGREGALKWVSLALLDDKGRVASSYFMSRVEANADATRSFPIDHTGRYVLRFTAQGAEGTAYKIELGGNALAMQ